MPHVGTSLLFGGGAIKYAFASFSKLLAWPTPTPSQPGRTAAIADLYPAIVLAYKILYFIKKPKKVSYERLRCLLGINVFFFGPIKIKYESFIVCLVYKILLLDTDLENPFLMNCLLIMSMLSVLKFLCLDVEICFLPG